MKLIYVIGCITIFNFLFLTVCFWIDQFGIFKQGFKLQASGKYYVFNYNIIVGS